MRPFLVLVPVLLAASSALAQLSGSYAGKQAREVKALSAQEQAVLLAGRDICLGRAGELNHIPARHMCWRYRSG